MRLLNRSRIRHLCLFLASLGVAFFTVLERSHFRCSQCGSRLDESQWYVGIPWFPVPVAGKIQKVSVTQFSQTFLPSHIQHDWRLAQSSPYYLVGTVWGGCCLGRRYVPPALSCYESSAEFRKFVHDEIRSGKITKEEFVRLATALPNDQEANAKTELLLIASKKR